MTSFYMMATSVFNELNKAKGKNEYYVPICLKFLYAYIKTDIFLKMLRTNSLNHNNTNIRSLPHSFSMHLFSTA